MHESSLPEFYVPPVGISRFMIRYEDQVIEPDDAALLSRRIGRVQTEPRQTQAAAQVHHPYPRFMQPEALGAAML